MPPKVPNLSLPIPGSVSDDDVSSEDIPNGNGVKNDGVTSGATNKLVKPTTNKVVKPVNVRADKIKQLPDDEVEEIQSKDASSSKGASRRGSRWSLDDLSTAGIADALKDMNKVNEDTNARAEMIEEEMRQKAGVSKKAVLSAEKYYTKILERTWSDLTWKEAAQVRIHTMLSHARFDAAMGVVIALNSVTIGTQISAELNKDDTTFYYYLEFFYVVVYSLELAARMFAYGVDCLQNPWVRFDFFLVAIGIFSMIVEPIIMGISAGGGGGEAVTEALRPIMVLKVLRLLRLARAVRLLAQFRALWMLVRGLLASALTILYTFILMFMLVYVYACIGIELVTKSEYNTISPAFAEIVQEQFVSIPRTMLTLCAFFTVDSVAAIYTPMVMETLPYPHILMYFMSFVLMSAPFQQNCSVRFAQQGSHGRLVSDRLPSKVQGTV
jgi:voltage-gated sodium channel